MGCDIHGEIHHKVDGKWCWLSDSENKWQNRSYLVFALLANVRNTYGIIPISTPRGLPEDIKLDYYYNPYGEHSFSWVTVDEIIQSYVNQKTELKPFLYNFVHYFYELAIEIEESTSNIRLVFGFDN